MSDLPFFLLLAYVIGAAGGFVLGGVYALRDVRGELKQIRLDYHYLADRLSDPHMFARQHSEGTDVQRDAGPRP